MIKCKRCGNENLSTSITCATCKEDLLPLLSKDTIVNVMIKENQKKLHPFIYGLIIVFIVLLLSTIFVYFQDVQWVDTWNALILPIVFFSFIILLGFLFSIPQIKKNFQDVKLSPTQHIAFRYIERAKELMKTDPKQAIDDFSIAIKKMPLSEIFTIHPITEAYGLRDKLYLQMGLIDESAAGWQEAVMDCNNAIEINSEPNKQRTFVTLRENLRKAHNIGPVLSKLVQTCSHCGKVYEGKNYLYYYGTPVKTEITSVSLNGHTKSKTYETISSDSAFICYKCIKNGDEEEGAFMAIEKRKKGPNLRHYDFFSPKQYKNLQRVSKPRGF